VLILGVPALGVNIIIHLDKLFLLADGIRISTECLVKCQIMENLLQLFSGYIVSVEWI